MYRPRARRAVNIIIVAGLCLFMLHVGPQLTFDLASKFTATRQNDLEKTRGRGRSWVDLSYLSSGRLRKITFLPEKFNSRMKPYVWMQLWSPLGEDPDFTQVYQLKWQRFYTLEQQQVRSEDEYKIEIPLNEAVYISENDKMGWTALSREVLAVSNQFDSDYGCLFYNFDDNGFPQLKNNYTFDGLVHPYRFAIHIDVDDT